MNNKSIFETKEQYLSFRAAFAAAQNDQRAKHFFRMEMTQKTRYPGWLQAEHFILLNAVRGKPLNRGFTPITNKNKIVSNWGDPMHGFSSAHRTLLRAQTQAQRLVAGIEDYKPSGFEARMYERLPTAEREAIYQQKRLEIIDKCGEAAMRILGPFAGTLTLEQFAALDLKTSE